MFPKLEIDTEDQVLPSHQNILHLNSGVIFEQEDSNITLTLI